MKDLTVTIDITIRHAMKTLDRTAESCLLVVDKNNKLLGTLTDGDLRRSILAGKVISATIEDSFFRDPIILTKDKYNKDEALELLRTEKLGLLPIVDDKHHVVDYLTWSKLGEKNKIDQKSLSDVVVVIMAGGKGARLEPFTKVLPKPLIPVQEKPIIEHIIDSFTKLGCSDFHITVNYKGKILKAYLEELQPDYLIHFVEEKEPLGTAGSLRFLHGRFDTPFFVTNCDIIIKADYTSLYKFHQNGGYAVTLVASAKEYIIPYGTCELNNEGHLSHINEKPKYDFLINVGLYIIDPGVLSLIPKNRFFHITHLIEEVKNQGKKVGVFPIDDDAWIDVGQWTEYQQVVKKL